ncbi:uncharacterized protein MICPUCDRAFT_58620 [Micromonas pusilla CCMP1545]|uniref:Predicted protein n=1 Tax=Micromonas pusilla (strain CCMP1545) TaxID=564608 RepID=C1MU04_MICPC|nr:uncharacterized protein MICPUCDRAFT_58620 [Micromonas pusilla CCMP1545]EEH56543.1 predicted protein [Micromonas pusilla CCMP1545]|eukprot:XP_003059411.1 predicted protein [Micromonas pusilla CCMP1545]
MSSSCVSARALVDGGGRTTPTARAMTTTTTHHHHLLLHHHHHHHHHHHRRRRSVFSRAASTSASASASPPSWASDLASTLPPRFERAPSTYWDLDAPGQLHGEDSIMAALHASGDFFRVPRCVLHTGPHTTAIAW